MRSDPATYSIKTESLPWSLVSSLEPLIELYQNSINKKRVNNG